MLWFLQENCCLMCKAKLHLKSPCIHRGGRRKRMEHLANCYHLSSRDVKLLYSKYLLGMQPVCAAESISCSGEPMIKSSKTKCYLNKAKCTHRISLAIWIFYREKGSYVASSGDTCDSMFQNSDWEPGDQGEVEVEAHSFKAYSRSTQKNGWKGSQTSRLLVLSSINEKLHFFRSAIQDSIMGIVLPSPNTVSNFPKVVNPLCWYMCLLFKYKHLQEHLNSFGITHSAWPGAKYIGNWDLLRI